MAISKAGMTGHSYGAIFYAMREKNAEVIGGTFYGDKRDILAQSAAWNRTRPDVQCNMAHLIESYNLDEKVSDETIVARCQEKLKRLGFEDCPYLLVKHTDKEHLHVHTLVSRIRADGSIVDVSNIALRAIAVTKELDAEFGMHQTPFHFRAERVGRKEYEMMRETGEDSQNQILRNIIQKAAQQSEKSFEKFLTNLEQEKVGFWLYLNEDQTDVEGIAFDCQKIGRTKGISGSGLGTGFGFPTLSKHVGYDKEKDLPKLIAKYQLKPQSEIQSKSKNSKRNDGKEAYILVSHPVSSSIKNEDSTESSSEETLEDNASGLTDSKPIDTLQAQVENPLEKNESKSKLCAVKTEAVAEDFPPVNFSPKSIAGSENQIPTIEKNDDGEFAETVNSEDVLIKGREVQLFYKTADKDADGETTKDDLQATTRLIKSLQNKIDWAQDSAETFSGFLRNLQSKKIICLPEIDDDGRVFDFVFIKKGIVVSSDELGEDYKFSALARKFDYSDKPIFAAPPFEDPNSFQTQAAILRDKPLSEYWWKMKAETDDKGQVMVNPAAFEFLRLAYKQTFQTDVKNFEDSFNETGTTDKFLQTLDYMQEHVGIYRESVASINKTIAEGRQTLGNGTLILLPDDKSAPRQATHFSRNSTSLSENLIEQKQPDKTYAEFQSIFKQAGLEKILETKSGTAEFETLGNSPASYQIVFSADEIKFNRVENGDEKTDALVENRSITFRKDEAGDYQPAASAVIPDDLHPEAVVRYIRDDAVEKINFLKTSELGKNIIVTRLDIENDSRAEIEEINRANLEKYVSRQLGHELAAEITLRTARYNETAFRDNADDERLKVTANIGRGEETREVSRADLLREREAIVQSCVNHARTQGSLEDMVEDVGISIKAAEKRQNRKETIKTEAMQKPWMDALDKAIAGETSRLEEITAQADSQLKAEKSETDWIIKQTRIEDAKQIKPTLSPEKIWLEQIKAVKRFDNDTFIKLEEIHQASNLPRPNDVYARLRGMETVAEMNVRRDNAALVERFGREASEQNIIVNLRRESGELKLENWHMQKTEQPTEQFTKEIQEDSIEIKIKQTSRPIKAPRPLTDKISPVSSAKTDLSWIADNKKVLNPYLNAVSVIKNDEGLQIIRAVADYIDQKGKNEQLADLTKKAVNAVQTLKPDSASEAHDKAARLSRAIQTAIQREEAMRENLRLDKSIHTELIETPEPLFKDAELKQIGMIAAEIGDVREVKDYYDLLKKDVEFADAVGETEERCAADFFLAEARAVQQSNNAIERITPLPDGSINVELNPAQLTQAIDSFKTADVFEQFQSAASEKSIIRSLSLEEISQTGQFLAANNQIADSLNDQVFTTANDLVKTLEPPQNQTEQEMIKQWTFTQDFYNRLEQMNRNEQFLDEMARQAETDSQNQAPFQQSGRNCTFVNLPDRAETKEMQFWENDRTQREAQIANERAVQRLQMTEDEKAQVDAADLEEAEAFELKENAEITESRIISR